MEAHITHVDTACILIEINGYKILTDPTLDRAGALYYHGYGTFSRKTSEPAIDVATLEDVDLILLSHHQHRDNLDTTGKELTRKVKNVISTKAASKEMSNIIGLDDWETISISTPKLKGLKITATPAQHHPWWIPEFLSGKVIGFVIEFDGQTNGVIYISGDTVYFDGIAAVASKFKVDLGIFHVGSVQFRYLTGFGHYTMDGRELVKAAKVMNPNKIIPIHHKGWTHFKQKESELEKLLTTNEATNYRTIFLQSGKRTSIS